MAVWKDLYPLVADQAHLAPVGVVVGHAKRAVTEFLENTGIWREILAPFDVVPGVNEYTLAPPAGAQITGLVSVRCADRLLGVTRGGEWPYGDTTEGTPSLWKFEPTDTLRIYPTPTAAVSGSIEVVARCVPAVDATSFPDSIMAQWGPVLADGVLSTLLMGRGQPWKDSQLALHYRQEFREGIAAARIKDTKSGAKTGLRVQPRRYGG